MGTTRITIALRHPRVTHDQLACSRQCACLARIASDTIPLLMKYVIMK